MGPLRMPASLLAWLTIAIGSCASPRSEPARIPDRDLTFPTEKCATAVIELQNASSAEVVKTLDDLLAASREASARRIGPGSCVLYPPGAHPVEPKPSVRLVACTDSNTIRVQAPPDDLLRIRELIARLDGVWEQDGFVHVRERR